MSVSRVTAQLAVPSAPPAAAPSAPPAPEFFPTEFNFMGAIRKYKSLFNDMKFTFFKTGGSKLIRAYLYANNVGWFKNTGRDTLIISDAFKTGRTKDVFKDWKNHLTKQKESFPNNLDFAGTFVLSSRDDPSSQSLPNVVYTKASGAEIFSKESGKANYMLEQLLMRIYIYMLREIKVQDLTERSADQFQTDITKLFQPPPPGSAPPPPPPPPPPPGSAPPPPPSNKKKTPPVASAQRSANRTPKSTQTNDKSAGSSETIQNTINNLAESFEDGQQSDAWKGLSSAMTMKNYRIKNIIRSDSLPSLSITVPTSELFDTNPRGKEPKKTEFLVWAKTSEEKANLRGTMFPNTARVSSNPNSTIITDPNFELVLQTFLAGLVERSRVLQTPRRSAAVADSNKPKNNDSVNWTRHWTQILQMLQFRNDENDDMDLLIMDNDFLYTDSFYMHLQSNVGEPNGKLEDISLNKALQISNNEKHFKLEGVNVDETTVKNLILVPRNVYKLNLESEILVKKQKMNFDGIIDSGTPLVDDPPLPRVHSPSGVPVKGYHAEFPRSNYYNLLKYTKYFLPPVWHDLFYAYPTEKNDEFLCKVLKEIATNEKTQDKFNKVFEKNIFSNDLPTWLEELDDGKYKGFTLIEFFGGKDVSSNEDEASSDEDEDEPVRTTKDLLVFFEMLEGKDFKVPEKSTDNLMVMVPPFVQDEDTTANDEEYLAWVLENMKEVPETFTDITTLERYEALRRKINSKIKTGGDTTTFTPLDKGLIQTFGYDVSAKKHLRVWLSDNNDVRDTYSVSDFQAIYEKLEDEVKRQILTYLSCTYERRKKNDSEAPPKSGNYLLLEEEKESLSSLRFFDVGFTSGDAKSCFIVASTLENNGQARLYYSYFDQKTNQQTQYYHQFPNAYSNASSENRRNNVEGNADHRLNLKRESMIILQTMIAPESHNDIPVLGTTLNEFIEYWNQQGAETSMQAIFEQVHRAQEEDSGESSYTNDHDDDQYPPEQQPMKDDDMTTKLVKCMKFYGYDWYIKNVFQPSTETPIRVNKENIRMIPILPYVGFSSSDEWLALCDSQLLRDTISLYSLKFPKKTTKKMLTQRSTSEEETTFRIHLNNLKEKVANAHNELILMTLDDLEHRGDDLEKQLQALSDSEDNEDDEDDDDEDDDDEVDDDEVDDGALNKYMDTMIRLNELVRSYGKEFLKTNSPAWQNSLKNLDVIEKILEHQKYLQHMHESRNLADRARYLAFGKAILEMQDKLSLSDATIQELNKRIKSIEQERDELTKKTVNDLTLDVDNLNFDVLLGALDDPGDPNIMIQDLREKIEKLTTELEETKQELKTQKASFESSKQKNEDDLKKAQEEVAELGKAREEVKTLNALIQDLRMKEVNAQGQFFGTYLSSAEAENLKNDLKIAQNKLELAEQKVLNLEKTNKDIQTQQENAASRLAELEKQLKENKEQTVRVNEAQQTLTQKRDALSRATSSLIQEEQRELFDTADSGSVEDEAEDIANLVAFYRFFCLECLIGNESKVTTPEKFLGAFKDAIDKWTHEKDNLSESEPKQYKLKKVWYDIFSGAPTVEIINEDLRCDAGGSLIHPLGSVNYPISFPMTLPNRRMLAEDEFGMVTYQTRSWVCINGTLDTKKFFPGYPIAMHNWTSYFAFLVEKEQYTALAHVLTRLWNEEASITNRKFLEDNILDDVRNLAIQRSGYLVGWLQRLGLAPSETQDPFRNLTVERHIAGSEFRFRKYEPRNDVERKNTEKLRRARVTLAMHATSSFTTKVRIPSWIQASYANRYVVFLSSTCPHCIAFQQSAEKQRWVEEHDAIVYEFGSQTNEPPPDMKVADVRYVPMIVFFDETGCAYHIK